ncbi:ubiquitin-associated protein 1-like [Pseudoliparis swirei]|uniref:ubiquitin-associated protein 1-like n=1 Tax=Pseudoliparis swirei TaxID=2059687 RepID=UPI0024BEA491|nr:ubiquitin-associated protein 1-like [Pseudoliparis swirei]
MVTVRTTKPPLPKTPLHQEQRAAPERRTQRPAVQKPQGPQRLFAVPSRRQTARPGAAPGPAGRPPPSLAEDQQKEAAFTGLGGQEGLPGHAPRSLSTRRHQQRPSSAGPVGSNYGQKALRAGGSRGLFFDSSAELLSALSEEERELLETITGRGFPLRTAILALQKTGYHSPQKILKYLVASERLCELGYAEAQVEEALDMFQNCESQAAEFLHLLTQFNEIQPNAIKEVLLLHENHRERALEELMTRIA